MPGPEATLYFVTESPEGEKKKKKEGCPVSTTQTTAWSYLDFATGGQEET